ncbi:MAG: carboxypeptidase regulatory-like domain-containing protein [Lentisphaeria bacterium]|nr:carboxypeptidase regulatory-like domain-containing protein [Lentisphaeria bacterium]
MLESGRTLVGRVVDGRGNPVPNAIVEGWGRYGGERAQGFIFGPAAVPVRSWTLTTESGEFLLSGLSGKVCLVHARARGFLSSSYLREPVRVALTDAPHPITLKLEDLYSLRAVARDETTDEPISTAAYTLQLRKGWMPAGGSAAYAPPFGGGCLHGNGIGEVLCFNGSDRTSVYLTASAPGYEESIATLDPIPVRSAEGRAYCMALRRLADHSGVASVSARCTDWEPFSGPLLLHLLEPTGRKHLIPIVFQDGSAGKLKLPAGVYDAWLQGLQGSTIAWRKPNGPYAQRLIVKAGQESALVFHLEGCRVTVQPRAQGGPVAAFGIRLPTVELLTWTTPVPFERSGAGVVLYVDVGTLDIRIKKFGFETVQGHFDIATAPSVLAWHPEIQFREEPAPHTQN